MSPTYLSDAAVVSFAADVEELVVDEFVVVEFNVEEFDVKFVIVLSRVDIEALFFRRATRVSFISVSLNAHAYWRVPASSCAVLHACITFKHFVLDFAAFLASDVPEN